MVRRSSNCATNCGLGFECSPLRLMHATWDCLANGRKGSVSNRAHTGLISKSFESLALNAGVLSVTDKVWPLLTVAAEPSKRVAHKTGRHSEGRTQVDDGTKGIHWFRGMSSS